MYEVVGELRWVLIPKEMAPPVTVSSHALVDDKTMWCAFNIAPASHGSRCGIAFSYDGGRGKSDSLVLLGENPDKMRQAAILMAESGVMEPTLPSNDKLGEALFGDKWPMLRTTVGATSH